MTVSCTEAARVVALKVGLLFGRVSLLYSEVSQIANILIIHSQKGLVGKLDLPQVVKSWTFALYRNEVRFFV